MPHDQRPAEPEQGAIADQAPGRGAWQADAPSGAPARSGPAAWTPSQVLAVQRAAGNRAVARLLGGRRPAPTRSPAARLTVQRFLNEQTTPPTPVELGDISKMSVEQLAAVTERLRAGEISATERERGAITLRLLELRAEARSRLEAGQRDRMPAAERERLEADISAVDWQVAAASFESALFTEIEGLDFAYEMEGPLAELHEVVEQRLLEEAVPDAPPTFTPIAPLEPTAPLKRFKPRKQRPWKEKKPKTEAAEGDATPTAPTGYVGSLLGQLGVSERPAYVPAPAPAPGAAPAISPARRLRGFDRQRFPQQLANVVGELIDEGVAVLQQEGPYELAGEDTVELQCWLTYPTPPYAPIPGSGFVVHYHRNAVAANLRERNRSQMHIKPRRGGDDRALTIPESIRRQVPSLTTVKRTDYPLSP